MNREEIQRDVVDYEGLYTVDIFGNVFRVDGKELIQSKNKFGYMNVNLRKNGKQKQYKVHRLVAQAFIPNPQNKKQVNHIDGNKAHNSVWNLEWSTCKENIIHSYATGLTQHGISVRVLETGKVYRNITECAKDIDGNIGNIYACITGRRKSCNGFHFEEVI